MRERTRNTVTLPAEVREQVAALRRTERFCRCTYSEIVRQLLAAGLETLSNLEENMEEQAERREKDEV